MKATPIPGEIGRYRVESRSKKDCDEHTVDILEDACGCRDWICNHASERREGRTYRCAHLKAARECALESYIETMREFVSAQ